ncbi:MAG TPA: tetratricopeptide repeat protein, partial [Wenzhouxiangellaceae bacterium]|nr:tetratricopeptide repeat protein [Wenzhouxiangellaceae bacterium]
NVGLLQNDLGHYVQAEQTLRRSIELHRQVGGPETEQVTAPLHNLSLSLRRQGRLEEARTASMEALAIKRAAGDWSLSSLAVTLAALANIERERGVLPAALAHSEESLELREEVFGRDNVMIASGLVTHAEILNELGRHPDAERLLREALALHEAAGTMDGLRGADVRLALGTFLVGRSRLDAARAMLEPALASAIRELPEGSPELDRYRQALATASNTQ